MTRLVRHLGERLIAACQDTGGMLTLFALSLYECRRAPDNWRRVFAQMKRIGNDTFPIAAAMAIFTGFVLTLHTGFILRQFDAAEAVSVIVVLGMVKEMGPVFTSMLLAGRIGASIAAEVGTMQINEEIDALKTMGINPVRYLAMPRFLGCVTMLPALVITSSFVGSLGGAMVSNVYFEITLRVFYDTAFRSMDYKDLVESLLKSLTFGALVAVIACRRGFQTRGGAEGVGRAITSAVVTSFVGIFVANYFITRLMI